MCKEGNITHEYVLYNKSTNSVLVAKTESSIKEIASAVVKGYKKHNDHRIVHLYNCQECPNSQVEYYQQEDAIAYQLAMNRINYQEI